jgi:hypothetical protein
MSLAIIVPYFNFCHYAVRQRNYETFLYQHNIWRQPIRVITVECAFGDAPFEVTTAGHGDHVQVRAEKPLWVKENLINIGIQHAIKGDPGVTAFGWFDADLMFNNPDWYTEALVKLEQYHAIQPFERVTYREKDGREIFTLASFARQPAFTGFAMPGCAWLMRRDAYEYLGGLLDCHIIGGGDTFLSNALNGKHEQMGIAEPASLLAWVARCKNLAVFPTVPRQWGGHQVGWVHGTLDHLYHGAMEKRHYGSRYAILLIAKYDPDTDLIKNADGVIQLVGKPDLQAAIEDYFHMRQEDA